MIKTLKIFSSVVLLGLLTHCGLAQDYAVMPLNDSFDIEKIKAEPEVNNDAKRAASVLRQRISKQQQNASLVYRTGDINNQFKAYFNQVILPGLTRYDRDSLSQLNAKHQKIIKDLATRVRAPAVFRYLIQDVFFPKLGEIVDGNYHPAVRYNAILTIGRLDEVVGKQRVSAPRPYRNSLPYLVTKYNEFSDPKLAFLKYGAFRGIARIAAIEFQKGSTAADAAKPILTALLGPKPAGMPDDLHQSMQKTAVITLGMLGDPANADSFARMVADESLPIWTRAEAAVAFSKLKTASYDGAKLEAIAKSTAKLMHDVLKNEVLILDRTQRRIAVLAARKKEVSLDGAAAGLSGSTPGMSPGAGGSEDPFEGEDPSSAGGSSDGAMRGGNSSGPPKSGPGGSGGGPRKKGAIELTDLPEYRITLSRRRIKTIALALVESFGTTSGTTGMLRWANADQALLGKLSKMKTHMQDADKAAEVGLESAIGQSVTDAIRGEFTKVADQIAQTLGAKPPKAGQPPKSPKGGKKGGEKKKSGSDPFINQ